MCRDDGNMNIIIIIIIIVIIIIIFTFAKYNPRELKIEYKWVRSSIRAVNANCRAKIGQH